MNKSMHAIIALCAISSLNAMTLKDTVKQTILTNDEISTNELKVISKKLEHQRDKRAYYPKLDLEAYLEKSKEKNHQSRLEETPWLGNNGGNIALKATQLLYDGGKTPSLINESLYEYQSTLNKSSSDNEDILLEIVQSYMNIVKFNEQNQYASFLTQAHKDTLVVAKDKEEISGETLPTQQTIYMLSNQIDKEDNQNMNYKRAMSDFKRLTGMDAVDLCKPPMDKELFNLPLEDVLKIGLENNYAIKEQMNKVNKQKAVYTTGKSNFKPNLQFKLDAIYDNNLLYDDNDINGGGTQKELNGKLTLGWNLYNGGMDSLQQESEQINLQEETKQLEVIKKEVIQRITNSYNNYHTTLHRVDNLKDSVTANTEILKLTREQLEDGTKTFIEEIQEQTKLIEAKINLSTQENLLYSQYYELLNDLSILRKTILLNEDQQCVSRIYDNPLINDNQSTDSIDLLLDDNNASDVAETNATGLVKELKDLANEHNVQFDEENIKFIIPITYKSFNKHDVNPDDPFRYVLDNISPKLLEIYSNYKAEIEEVRLESHTSSEYTKYIDKSLQVQAEANLALSKRRGDKVKKYFMNKVESTNIPSDIIQSQFNVYGMGPEHIILGSDGIEDRVASRRIEIKFIKR